MRPPFPYGGPNLLLSQPAVSSSSVKAAAAAELTAALCGPGEIITGTHCTRRQTCHEGPVGACARSHRACFASYIRDPYYVRACRSSIKDLRLFHPHAPTESGRLRAKPLGLFLSTAYGPSIERSIMAAPSGT